MGQEQIRHQVSSLERIKNTKNDVLIHEILTAVKMRPMIRLHSKYCYMNMDYGIFAVTMIYDKFSSLIQSSCDDRENVYFILLSLSNRKYESLTIV